MPWGTSTPNARRALPAAPHSLSAPCFAVASLSGGRGGGESMAETEPTLK